MADNDGANNGLPKGLRRRRDQQFEGTLVCASLALKPPEDKPFTRRNTRKKLSSNTSSAPSASSATPNPGRRYPIPKVSSESPDSKGDTIIVDTTSAHTISSETPISGVFTPASRRIPKSIPNPKMSSQRRAPRSGGRGGAQENGEEQAIWKDIQMVLDTLSQNEREAEDLKNKIFAEETRIKDMKSSGKVVSESEYKALEDMYRRQVRIQEDSAALIGSDTSSGVLQNVSLLTAMVKHNEEKIDQSLPRGSTSRDSRDSVSRNGMDLDGPSDSPGPPSAAERQARKLGAGRTSSLPPRSSNIDVVIKTGDTPIEAVERNSSRPKIVYAVGDDVAFKRKTGDESDWIQGIVTRVIGEGKSRRYEVKDPFPDAGTVDSNNVYKSSASQMVPIPSLDAKFEEYEVGKRVLALYPSTSTFYRADVKRMLENGTKVEVLFEEETEGKEVERRMVLNHTGQ